MNRREVLKTLGWLGLGTALPSSAFAQKTSTPSSTENSGIYRFSVGNFEAIAISDSTGAMPPKPVFAPEASEAEVDAVLKQYFLPTDKLAMNFNVLFIDTGKEKILIDSGYGAAGGGKLLDRLKTAGISPDQITAVFLSHCHPDHMHGLLSADEKIVFPKAQHYISAEEWNFWSSPTPDLSKMTGAKGSEKGFIDDAHKHLKLLEPHLVKVPSGTKLPDGIALELAPGHTPGHANFRFKSGQEELLHIVDLAHNHVLMFAKPDWSVGFDTVPEQARETRKKVFAQASTQGTRVFGYHLPFPAIGHIQKSDGAYRWLPEGWT